MVIERSNRALGMKWAKYLRRTRPDENIKRHRKCVADRRSEEDRLAEEKAKQADVKAVVVAAETEKAKEAKHIKSLAERQNQIFDMAMMGAKLALYEEKTDPITKKPRLRALIDLKGLAACLAQASTITNQMKGGEPANVQQTTNINFAALSDKELADYEKIAAKLEGNKE